MNKYSIIIPIHNEVNSIPILLKDLEHYTKEGHEIIIIDDGSDDGGTEILKKSNLIKLIIIDSNKGKGNAIKMGLRSVNNNKVLLFDGDMEISPTEISKLMILDSINNINFVMGCRFKSLNPLKSNFDWGNFMFTSFFNILFGLQHKDILCCAKAFYLNDINKYKIVSNGFDIDVELSALLSFINKQKKIIHILIDYKRRTILEGKKLKVFDGWKILLRIIKMARYL